MIDSITIASPAGQAGIPGSLLMPGNGEAQTDGVFAGLLGQVFSDAIPLDAAAAPSVPQATAPEKPARLSTVAAMVDASLIAATEAGMIGPAEKLPGVEEEVSLDIPVPAVALPAPPAAAEQDDDAAPADVLEVVKLDDEPQETLAMAALPVPTSSVPAAPAREAGPAALAPARATPDKSSPEAPALDAAPQEGEADAQANPPEAAAAPEKHANSALVPTTGERASGEETFQVAEPPPGTTEATDTASARAEHGPREAHAHRDPRLDPAAVSRPPIAHPVAAEQVAVRIGRAVREGVDRIQIALSPETLGAVDVELEVAADGRVDAVVRVERPETLELLQRDARQLVRTLQDAGLQADASGLSFQLRDGEQHRRHPAFAAFAQMGPGDQQASIDGETSPSAAHLRPSRRALGGVDIRV